MVCLKRRKYRLFLQIWRDFVLKGLEIHKGFLRLFVLHPACVCEISVIFFAFRYTLGQHRTIPALRLKHRSGICVAKMLDKTSSIICAFGLASAAPRSPYRHLELCGIALEKL
jgi:hypothetical protein